MPRHWGIPYAAAIAARWDRQPLRDRLFRLEQPFDVYSHEGRSINKLLLSLVSDRRISALKREARRARNIFRYLTDYPRIICGNSVISAVSLIITSWRIRSATWRRIPEGRIEAEFSWIIWYLSCAGHSFGFDPRATGLTITGIPRAIRFYRLGLAFGRVLFRDCHACVHVTRNRRYLRVTFHSASVNSECIALRLRFIVYVRDRSVQRCADADSRFVDITERTRSANPRIASTLTLAREACLTARPVSY